MSPWDEKYGGTLADILHKLSLEDLAKLTEMFECQQTLYARSKSLQ